MKAGARRKGLGGEAAQGDGRAARRGQERAAQRQLEDGDAPPVSRTVRHPGLLAGSVSEEESSFGRVATAGGRWAVGCTASRREAAITLSAATRAPSGARASSD